MSDDLAGQTSETRAMASQYRPAIQVSNEIRNHCHIYLDEQLYIIAIALLTDLVTSGASHPDYLTKPAFAPLPFHIELVGTLLVHPRYTTQAPPNERVELGFRSINFLRNILTILGPVNGKLNEAFSLSPPTRSRSSRRHWNVEDADDASASENEDKVGRMRGVVANRGRIRTCAKDFWHIVGWAFNCSVVHPKRWTYWKVWLDYMLDVLDADWNERERIDRNDSAFIARSKEDSEAENENKFLLDSLLVKYLVEVRGRSSAIKRIVKAAFADGSPESLRAYPEVFPNETRELPVQTGHKRKRSNEFEKTYGDYDDQDAEINPLDSSQPTDETPAPSQDTDDGDEFPTLDPWLGGPESIALRQRVLTLLSRAAAVLPESFGHLIDVYEVYYECIRPLPLPAFSLFISPSANFPIPVLVSLNQLLLVRLLPNMPPRRQDKHRENDALEQDVLERCFLPFSANTSSVQDNAKVSLLVESVFRMIAKGLKVYHTPSLESAIEKGIRARETKIKPDRRRKENSTRTKEEENDHLWLRASGERLRSLLSWVEHSEQNSSDHDD